MIFPANLNPSRTSDQDEDKKGKEISRLEKPNVTKQGLREEEITQP